MRQLAAQLLPHKIASGFGADAAGPGAASHAALQAAEEGAFGFQGLLLRVVGVYTQAALFVHIAIAHRDDDGVDRNVHHQDVED